MAHALERGRPPAAREREKSRAVVARVEAKEIFLAVVGHVGSGTSAVADTLQGLLEAREYACEILKAREVIVAWAEAQGLQVPEGRKDLAKTARMQDLGDEMREKTEDHAAVARRLIEEIRRRRAAQRGIEVLPGSPVEPDGAPRAYVLDSLRHPAEVHLLRRVYGDAFALVGVVCDEKEREKRLTEAFFEFRDRRRPETLREIREFMERDANDAVKPHGQHVRDAFHESDFFVDNTPPESDPAARTMNEDLGRLVDIISHARVVRPTIAETAMHHAYSAKLRSSCMSKQVGAALVDRSGNVVATGTNEVPKAGGGVYGEGFYSDPRSDSRCVFRDTPFCSNTREQNFIIDELLQRFPRLTDGRTREEVIRELRRTRIGGLIEFSRSVHAEMDALLSAARIGVSAAGCRLFVTTFPCHYCARHTVTAGVYEVQYIEPYPKSKALELHNDSITTDPSNWVPPREADTFEMERQRRDEREDGPAAREHPSGKVLFHPFVGVAPRLYERAFLKDRELKDGATGDFHLGSPEWGGLWSLSKVSYTQLEADLTEEG
jgi:deoxycytidylate deaminase